MSPLPTVTVSCQELKMAAKASFIYDCFLTHDWGKDEKGRDNHQRVSAINTELKRRGFRTWFDEDRMRGNIQKQMAAGIDQSAVVVGFITRRYHDKVNGEDDQDNCQLEFPSACRKKKVKNIVTVVNEQRMCNTQQWDGLVGSNLGGELYYRNWEDDISSTVQQIADAICDRFPDANSRIKGSSSGKPNAAPPRSAAPKAAPPRPSAQKAAPASQPTAPLSATERKIREAERRIAEAEMKVEEAERNAKEEAERKAKEEAERKAERKAKEEAERKAREEAEKERKLAEVIRRAEEAERKAMVAEWTAAHPIPTAFLEKHKLNLKDTQWE